jgi:hypothetical protein
LDPPNILSHLEKKLGSRGVTNEILEAIDHCMSTFGRGKPQSDADGITRESHNERAARQYDNSWSPTFSDQSAFANVMALVSDDELRSWLELNELLGTVQNSRVAKQHLRTTTARFSVDGDTSTSRFQSPPAR